MIIPTGDQNDHRTPPRVTATLVLSNLALFVYVNFALDPTARAEFFALWGFTPAQGVSVTVLTSQFLHVSWLHLLGNLLFLWVFGDNLEDWLGHGPFLVFYLATGALACLVHMGVTSLPASPTIGASGAVAGVMGGYMVLLPRNRVTFWLILWLVFLRFDLPALYAIALYAAGDLVLAMLAASGDDVAHVAHLGGLVAGILGIWTLRAIVYRARNRGRFGGADIGRLASSRSAHDPPTKETREDRELRALIAAENYEVLLRRVIQLASHRRRLPVVNDTLLQVARALLAGGHETVAGNVLQRLELRDPGGGHAAAVQLQLAELYSGVLLDLPRARLHAQRALKRGARHLEARELLRRLPQPAFDSRRPVTLLALDDGADARARAEPALRDHGLLGASAVPPLPADAVRPLRFLARGLPPHSAVPLLADLEDLGLAVLAVPSASVERPPPARRPRRAVLTERGIELTLRDGAHRTLEFSELGHACACFVPAQSARSSVLRHWSAREIVARGQRLFIGMAPSRAPGRTVGRRVGATVTLTAADGAGECFVLDENELATAVHSSRWPRAPWFQTLAWELLAHDELLYVGGGITALAGLENPERYVLSTSAEVEDHHLYWWNRFRFSGQACYTR